MLLEVPLSEVLFPWGCELDPHYFLQLVRPNDPVWLLLASSTVLREGAMAALPVLGHTQTILKLPIIASLKQAILCALLRGIFRKPVLCLR